MSYLVQVQVIRGTDPARWSALEEPLELEEALAEWLAMTGRALPRYAPELAAFVRRLVAGEVLEGVSSATGRGVRVGSVEVLTGRRRGPSAGRRP